MNILPLPYVDGIPEEGQSRINWMTDGELLTGSMTLYGNEGSSNRVNVQLQRNISVLFSNSITTSDEIDANSQRISVVEDAISQSGSTTLIQRVDTAESKIQNLEVENINTAEKIRLNTIEVEQLQVEIGIPPEGTSTIFDALNYIKTEVGNPADFDIHGASVPGNISSGLIRKVDDTLMQAVVNRNDIVTINETLTVANLDQMKTSISNLSTDLGTNTRTSSAFIQINDNYENIASMNLEISKINSNIDFSNPISISTRTTTLESDVNSIDSLINDPTTGLSIKVTTNTQNIASVQGLANSTYTDTQTLFGIVGQTTSQGLQLNVANLETRIGTEISPTPESIQGQLNALKTMQAALQDAQLEIIDLTDRVAALEAAQPAP